MRPLVSVSSSAAEPARRCRVRRRAVRRATKRILPFLAVALHCARTVSGQDSDPSVNPEDVFESVVDDGGNGGPSPPSSTAELPPQDVVQSSSEFEGSDTCDFLRGLSSLLPPPKVLSCMLTGTAYLLL